MIKDKTKTDSHLWLEDHLQPGQTIYTILRSVARSGMSRKISPLLISSNDILDISYHASRVLNWKLTDSGILVEGCGMDMGFHLVYNLSRVLYNDGYILKQRWL